MNGLSGCAFEEVVDNRRDEPFVIERVGMNQRLVRVNRLLQIGCMRNIVRKGGIGIKIGKQFVRFFLRERFFRSDDGGTENTSCKIAPTGDKLDIAGKSGLQLPQRLFDCREIGRASCRERV